jgi:hypothetical protein
MAGAVVPFWGVKMGESSDARLLKVCLLVGVLLQHQPCLFSTEIQLQVRCDRPTNEA